MHARLSQEHPPFLVSNSEHGYGIYTAPFHLPLRGAAGEQIKMKEAVFPESSSKKTDIPMKRTFASIPSTAIFSKLICRHSDTITVLY